jgi:phosphate uptake regulator
MSISRIKNHAHREIRNYLGMLALLRQVIVYGDKTINIGVFACTVRLKNIGFHQETNIIYAGEFL